MKNKALQLVQTIGPVKSASHCHDITTPGHRVYMVTNGPHIFQLGKGSAKRMKLIMRGSLAGKHNKAFICAIAETVFQTPNEYHYVTVDDKIATTATEEKLHTALGVQTNKTAATWIVNLPMSSIEEVHQWLCAEARKSSIYQQLDPAEQQMAEELFDLITYGTSQIKRSNRTVRSCQGDNLEGNILMRLQKRHLINIFEKLSQNYLRYGKHRLSDEEFQNLKQTYSYQVQGKPHIIYG